MSAKRVIEMVMVIESMEVASNKNALARAFIGQDDAFWDIAEDEELGGHAFKKLGYSATQCTGYACSIRVMLGSDRVKVFGLSEEENPESAVAQFCFGHDFAVVDNRFIVDPWLVDVGTDEPETQGVFDLRDPEDAIKIKRYYGNQSKWKESRFEDTGRASFRDV